MAQPQWKIYERIAGAFVSENEGIEASVTPNAQITGYISGTMRQVDILIDARWGDDLTKRVIVDAKRYRNKVDIKDVESFKSMMEDCRATRGIIVCPNGWTDGAKRRAQDAITIMLLPLAEVENGTWDAALEECYGQCDQSQKRLKKPGMVLWDGQHLLQIERAFLTVFTGKCDVCHDFHVWCWDCGGKFAIADEETYQCSCGYLWLSPIEEEQDDPSGQTLNAVHLLLQIEGQVIPLDRRMLW